jgi:hypothetical protein
LIRIQSNLFKQDEIKIDKKNKVLKNIVKYHPEISWMISFGKTQMNNYKFGEKLLLQNTFFSKRKRIFRKSSPNSHNFPEQLINLFMDCTE